MKLVLFDDNGEEYSIYLDVTVRDEDSGNIADTQGGEQFLAHEDGELLDTLTTDVFNIQWNRR